MELIYLIQALLRKKWIILSCFFTAIIAAFLFTINQKPQYVSTAQIATGFTQSVDLKLIDEKFNTQQIDVKFNNIIENITSEKVLQLLSYNLILHDLTDKKPFKQLSQDNKNSSDYTNVDITTAIKLFQDKLSSIQLLDADVAEDRKLINFIKLYGYDPDAITDNIKVTRYQKTDYINIEYKSENPYLSAFAVNTLFKEFSRYYSQTTRTSKDVSISSLDSTVSEKKIILDQKIEAKRKYMADNNIVDVNIQSGSQYSQVSTFENQLAEEKGKVQNLTYRVAQLDNFIKDARTKGVNSISSSKIITENNETYVALKKEFNTLNSEFIQKGSSDLELKKRLDKISESMKKLDLESGAHGSEKIDNQAVSIDELVQKKLDSEGELRAANEKISIIKSNLSVLKNSIGGIASSGAGLEKYDKEIQIATTEYGLAKDKLNEAKNITGSSNNFKQSLIGQPSLKPEDSHRLLIIGLAGFATLIVSSISIILIEYLDQSIKTPSQFQRLTHLPLLGTINFLKLNANILENVNEINSDDPNRHNTFRELLRKLRYEIEESGKRIFLFTSTEPQQGKTTIIQALSYSLSLGKKKVLIIDTNFCNNDLTKSLSSKPVLEKFQVTGNTFSLKAVEGLITKTQVEGVDSIGCGEGDYTPSEILLKNHLLNYLQELLQVYDFIFLEGAPLNNYTDTKELMNYIDGLIAVFSSETSITASDKESIKFLHHHRNKFLGAILNKVQLNDIDM